MRSFGDEAEAGSVPVVADCRCWKDAEGLGVLLAPSCKWGVLRAVGAYPFPDDPFCAMGIWLKMDKSTPLDGLKGDGKSCNGGGELGGPIPPCCGRHLLGPNELSMLAEPGAVARAVNDASNVVLVCPQVEFGSSMANVDSYIKVSCRGSTCLAHRGIPSSHPHLIPRLLVEQQEHFVVSLKKNYI